MLVSYMAPACTRVVALIVRSESQQYDRSDEVIHGTREVLIPLLLFVEQIKSKGAMLNNIWFGCCVWDI